MGGTGGGGDAVVLGAMLAAPFKTTSATLLKLALGRELLMLARPAVGDRPGCPVAPPSTLAGGLLEDGTAAVAAAPGVLLSLLALACCSCGRSDDCGFLSGGSSSST